MLGQQAAVRFLSVAAGYLRSQRDPLVQPDHRIQSKRRAAAATFPVTVGQQEPYLRSGPDGLSHAQNVGVAFTTDHQSGTGFFKRNNKRAVLIMRPQIANTGPSQSAGEF